MRRNVSDQFDSMKALSILSLSLLLGAGFSYVFSDECYDVWKSGVGWDKPISDVDQWAADNFSDAPDGETDYWKLQKFNLDIDHDGIPEVFVTSLRLHGNGGGPHLVFQKRGQSYYYIGQLPGRKHTMRVLPIGADGLPRVMTFSNSGEGSGVASVWKWDGKGFTRLSSEVIHSGDSGMEEGRRRFEELFGKRAAESDEEENESQPIHSETN